MSTELQLPGDLYGAAGVLAVAAALGVIGGLAQSWTAKDPTESSIPLLKSATVGVVAAIGALWAQVPGTAVALVGQSLLAGYFGRAVLAVLQTRVTAALERARGDRAVAVAEHAVGLLERGGPSRSAALKEAGPEPVEPEVVALRARLTDIASR